jgi:hypothetical protein
MVELIWDGKYDANGKRTAPLWTWPQTLPIFGKCFSYVSFLESGEKLRSAP